MVPLPELLAALRQLKQGRARQDPCRDPPWPLLGILCPATEMFKKLGYFLERVVRTFAESHLFVVVLSSRQ